MKRDWGVYSTAYTKINGWAYNPLRENQYGMCERHVPLPEREGDNHNKHVLIEKVPPQVRGGAVYNTCICGVQFTFPLGPVESWGIGECPLQLYQPFLLCIHVVRGIITHLVNKSIKWAFIVLDINAVNKQGTTPIGCVVGIGLALTQAPNMWWNLLNHCAVALPPLPLGQSQGFVVIVLFIALVYITLLHSMMWTPLGHQWHRLAYTPPSVT